MLRRKPSVATLRRIDESKAGAMRRVFEMTRAELEETESGAQRARECYHRPQTCDIRLHVLNDAGGLHGVESVESESGEFASYLNTGDSYADTVIYWRGRYRVQSVGDFVETLERAGVKFK